MTVARAWRRRLYGGAFTAALVPGVMLCVLLVLAFAGGFARLGDLAQALSGPAIPSQTTAPAATQAALPAGALAALSPGTTATSRSASGSTRLLAAVPPGPRTVGGNPSISGARPRPSAVTGIRTTAPARQGGRPAPPPRHTLADGIVNAATVITAQLPGPAGPAATSAVQSVGATVDRILPPGLPAAP